MKKISYLKMSQLNPLWEDSQIKDFAGKFADLFKDHLKGEFFSFAMGQNDQQVQVTVTLCADNGSWQYPVQCVYPLDGDDFGEKQKVSPQHISLLILKYLVLYWEDYFANDRDTFVTLDWSAHEFEGATFFVRGCVRHVDLERQANQILQQSGLKSLEAFGFYGPEDEDILL